MLSKNSYYGGNWQLLVETIDAEELVSDVKSFSDQDRISIRQEKAINGKAHANGLFLQLIREYNLWDEFLETLGKTDGYQHLLEFLTVTCSTTKSFQG